MALQDMFNNDDDDELRKRAQSGGLSSFMQTADNSPSAANSNTFNDNMKDIMSESPAMSDYFKKNPVDVARTMMQLKRALQPINPGLSGVR